MTRIEELHIGITGSREGLTQRQLWFWHQSMPWLSVMQEFVPGGVWLHHGDCVGVDEEVHHVLVEAGFSDRIIVHPPKYDIHRAYCLPGGPENILPVKPYKDRNQDIVRASQMLWGFPSGAEDDPQQRRSGTWQTIRMGRAPQSYSLVTVIMP